MNIDSGMKEVAMNGLRVFVHTDRSDNPSLFYSRRGVGPTYSWHYQENLGQWRVARVTTGNLRPQDLCVTSWKSVPKKLQAQLTDHYLE
jgi:hypothetical protein